MPRANGSAPPEAIRIEDEVWEEAFARREPSSDTRRRRLRAIDGGHSEWLSDRWSESPSEDDSDWLKELQPDWLNQSLPEGRARAAEPVARARPAEATAAEFPAATWVGVSSEARAPVVTGTRFQVATGARAEAGTGPRAEAGTGARAEAATGIPVQAAPSVRGDVAPPSRRTVKIQGRGAERDLPLPDATRRRPPRRPYERAGFRPDRLAMWAVMLGFLLVFVAIVSGHG